MLLLLSIISFNLFSQNTKEIKLDGKKYLIKISNNCKYSEGIYDEVEAGKTIYLNLNREVKNKISLEQLTKLINVQGKYIDHLQKSNRETILLNKSNFNFIHKNLKNITLTDNEIIQIFDIEFLYLKIIKVIE